jgi:hypothetical protein
LRCGEALPFPTEQAEAMSNCCVIRFLLRFWPQFESSFGVSETDVYAVKNRVKRVLVDGTNPLRELLSFDWLKSIDFRHDDLSHAGKCGFWINDDFVWARSAASQSAKRDDQEVTVAGMAVVTVG